MLVVKLQYKDSNEPRYANGAVITDRREVRKNEMTKLYALSRKEAYEIYNNLISKHFNQNDYYQSELLQYVCIVDLSDYPPYSEYEVIEYREFT